MGYGYKTSPKPWQQFILSLLYQVAAPILPLVMEFLIKESVSEESVTITAAIYTITTGAASRQNWQRGAAALAALLYAGLYGAVLAVDNPMPRFNAFAGWGIVATSVVHIAERYDRHINNRETYWD